MSLLIVEGKVTATPVSLLLTNYEGQGHRNISVYYEPQEITFCEGQSDREGTWCVYCFLAMQSSLMKGKVTRKSVFLLFSSKKKIKTHKWLNKYAFEYGLDKTMLHIVLSSQY